MKSLGAFFIVCIAGMLPAINLDDELGLDTNGIGDEVSDGPLAAKLRARDLPIANVLPKTFLGIGGETPELFRSIGA